MAYILLQFSVIESQLQKLLKKKDRRHNKKKERGSQTERKGRLSSDKGNIRER